MQLFTVICIQQFELHFLTSLFPHFFCEFCHLKQLILKWFKLIKFIFDFILQKFLVFERVWHLSKWSFQWFKMVCYWFHSLKLHCHVRISNKLNLGENEIALIDSVQLSNTLKPRYNEPWYSEFCDIVNKTQLPFWGFTRHNTFDVVNHLL